MGNEDIGVHYHETGDLQRASQALHRMRDYCTSPKHLADMSLKIILVSIEQGNWMAVQSHVAKVFGLPLKAEEKAKLHRRLNAALGLAQMCSGNYRDAAESFLRVDGALGSPDAPDSPGSSFNEVMTVNDVAVYGGLCALASMDRLELQQKVLEHASFRTHLELEPHIRRAITFFCSSKFSQCLGILNAYRTDFLLDLFLRGQVLPLFGLIRSKSIIESFVPYKTVSLSAMAKAFATPEEDMLNELLDMIGQGSLNARVDMIKRVSSNPKRSRPHLLLLSLPTHQLHILFSVFTPLFASRKT